MKLPTQAHIRTNTLPLRIGANTQGANRFHGDIWHTYPGNSLRLIHRDPHLSYDADLPIGQWSHVGATIDGGTGQAVLYLNGKPVASR